MRRDPFWAVLALLLLILAGCGARTARQPIQDASPAVRQVRVIRAQQEITAQAISIAPDGGLVCRKAGETFVIRAGEASVRGLYGYL